MNSYRITDAIPSRPRAVALGAFDGIHIGHRAVIAPLARHPNLVPSVVIITGIDGKPPSSLAAPDTRDRLLQTMVIEDVFELEFAAIRDLSPQAFVKEILHDRLGAKVVRCGFNFRFGAGAAGDVSLLKTLCEALDITVEVADAVEVDGEPVSTSRIRRAIEEGQVALAGRLLGRPVTIDVAVQHGQHLGRRLGTPTINQPLPDGFVRPRFGVYATAVIVNGVCMHGVTNIGVRPTVGAPAPLAETWIPDFIGDLYHKRVQVSLVKFLRDEVKFDGLTALKEQITRDEQEARLAVFGEAGESIQAILFDFDDTLQNSEIAYERVARQLIEKHFPHWDEATKAARVAIMVKRRNGGNFARRYVDKPTNMWYQLYFAELFEEWGVNEDPLLYHREVQRLFPWTGEPYDGLLPMLEDLRRRGYKLGIVTNGSLLMQHLKIDNSGLRPYVDVVLVSGEEGVGKPDPEIYYRAAARLGVHPSRCVFVGDYPNTDIAGAKAAGMRPVLVQTIRHADNPYDDVPTIDHTTELVDLL